MIGGYRAGAVSLILAAFAGVIPAANLTPSACGSLQVAAMRTLGAIPAEEGARAGMVGDYEEMVCDRLVLVQDTDSAPVFSLMRTDPDAASEKSANIMSGAMQLVALLVDRVHDIASMGEPVFILMLGTVVFGLGVAMRARLSRT